MFEPKFDFGGWKLHWKEVLFRLTLAASLAFLSSCGSKNSSSSGSSTPSVIVSCVPAQVSVLGTSTCTATPTNLSSTLVTWSVSGTGSGNFGSIDSKTGVYTAPSTVPTNNVVTITALSQADSTTKGTASITIQAAVAIAAITCVDPITGIQPSPLVVSSGNNLDCSATATGGASVSVTWALSNTNKLGGDIGSIAQTGVYAAPLVPPPGQSVTITATSTTVSSNTMSVPLTVVFGDKVISGPYAFSTSGRLTNSSNAFFARVGNLTAGGGNLTVIEDINQSGPSGGVKHYAPFPGSYSVGPEGRGTMQFCEGSTATNCPAGSPAATAFFRIVVIPSPSPQVPQRVQIIDFSSGTGAASISSSGEMVAQDQSVFGAGVGNLTGTYSFNFAGISNTAAEESVVGEFTASGFGTNGTAAIFADSPTTPGRIDIDATGMTTLAASTYSISSGRGSMTLNASGGATLVFSLYMVSASQAKVMESDSSGGILVGDAFKQQTSATCGWGPNALSGSTVFETAGASSAGAIADVGSFSANSGAVTSGSVDENNGGTVSSMIASLSGTYTVDPCGRGTLTLGSHSYIFYVISTSSAVLQETTSSVVAHGLLLRSQGGPFVNGSLSGSYALQLSGTNGAGVGGQREDILGQLTADGKGNIGSGSLDINSFGATQTGVSNTGPYTPDSTPAGTLRATLSLTPTRRLVLYLVSPTQFYVLDTDATGTAVGTLDNQF